jgi:replicative DNA helicase
MGDVVDFNGIFGNAQTAYEEEIDIKSLEQNAAKDKYAVAPVDVFEAASQYIDEFDASCQAEGKGYEAPSFPIWSQKMEGLMNGFYIFAGYSNSGKSAISMNLAMDYAMNMENKLYLIYYSLDDTKEDILSRILAMKSRIPISVARKPKRYEDKIAKAEDGSMQYQGWLDTRAKGVEQLKEMSKHFMVRDGETIDCIERMLNHAKMVKSFLQAQDPENNVIIVIDSLMDINIDSQNYREERDRNTAISKLVKQYATTEIKCPIFGTAHVRKNSGRRISISDLKESGRYEYDARAVFLVTNDVSRNGQNAEIYYTAPGDGERKHPVLEIYWAKNKASSFKERTYCYFAPEYSLASEVSKEQQEAYDAIIYAD